MCTCMEEKKHQDRREPGKNKIKNLNVFYCLVSHPHHELYRLLRKQTKPRGGSKATMPGMCF